jgi:chorismate-pyruvate lyase
MSEEHLVGQSASVTFLLGTRQPEVIVETMRNQGHCWNSLLQQCELRSLLAQIVARTTQDHIIATFTLDIIIAYDTIVTF